MTVPELTFFVAGVGLSIATQVWLIVMMWRKNWKLGLAGVLFFWPMTPNFWIACNRTKYEREYKIYITCMFTAVALELVPLFTTGLWIQLLSN